MLAGPPTTPRRPAHKCEPRDFQLLISASSASGRSVMMRRSPGNTSPLSPSMEIQSPSGLCGPRSPPAARSHRWRAPGSPPRKPCRAGARPRRHAPSALRLPSKCRPKPRIPPHRPWTYRAGSGSPGPSSCAAISTARALSNTALPAGNPGRCGRAGRERRRPRPRSA